MKQSVVLTTLLASLAVSTPLLDKRALVTEYDMVTVTETITGQDAAYTPAASSSSSGGYWNGNKWGWHWSSSSAAAAATTAAASPAYTAPVSSAAPVYTAASPTSAAAASTWAASSAIASTAAPSSTAPSSYAQTILDQHNNHRQNSSVPDLTWSTDMASIAQQIAASCVYAHNTAAGGGGYGQNIGAGTDDSGVGAMITNEMYNGEINWYPTPYGQENPDMTNFEHWGHYSQIVWKSTTSVGCYTQYCPNGLANVGSDVSPYFTVCNYSPPGNFGGEYGDNVLQPGNMATVTV